MNSIVVSSNSYRLLEFLWKPSFVLLVCFFCYEFDQFSVMYLLFDNGSKLSFVNKNPYYIKKSSNVDITTCPWIENVKQSGTKTKVWGTMESASDGGEISAEQPTTSFSWFISYLIWILHFSRATDG